MNLKQALLKSCDRLPKHEAENLLCDSLSISKTEIYSNPNRELTSEEFEHWSTYLKRRLSGEPLAYIHGEVEFYNCKIAVNSSVLIPRNETEQLVDRLIKEHSKNELSVWDLCCGSGAIGIALKKQLPHWNVTLSDICPDALALARENAKTNAVDVEFIEGDLLQPFQGKKADLIVSNPPYIPEKDILELDKEVKDHEPIKALDGGGDGLDFYRRFAEISKMYLNPGGKLCLEIGYDQGEAVDELFKKAGWDRRRLERDWSGQNRFFFVENE